MSNPTPRLVRVAGKASWHIAADGRRFSTGHTEREPAQKALDAWVFQTRRNAALAAGQTVATLLNAYLQTRRREATAGGVERLAYARKALTAFLGDWTIDRINRSTCLDYRDHRMTSVVLRTIRTELEALRAALHWGMTEEAGRIVSAMPDLVLPPKGNPRPRFLTETEADRLREACAAKHLKLFVEIGLHTGARSGAILSLTWDRVVLDERWLDFRIPEEIETNKRKVAQPITADLLAVLTTAKAAATSEFVIERAGGKVDAIKHGFHSACVRARLTDVTPHTMRHTVITWMLQRGVPIWEVATFAGMTVKLIEDTYGHATVNSKRRAARVLERRERPETVIRVPEPRARNDTSAQ
jgi:integrase